MKMVVESIILRVGPKCYMCGETGEGCSILFTSFSNSPKHSVKPWCMQAAAFDMYFHNLKKNIYSGYSF